MSRILLRHASGSIDLPAKVLCDRGDGGHLVVNPPRPVWERTALDVDELVAWSLLVAATGQAMLETLPQLRGGCLNYWEAGNWALHDLAPPTGPKQPRRDRRMHLHVFGRSRHARHPDWVWGESPRFPAFADSDRWSAQFAPLSDAECDAIAERADALLRSRYRVAALPGQP
jgi:diadenosine tetraphosphate (Ap4A) HIT family hydrolase